MYKQPKAIVFLGPPGSGKGTQAARLSAALEIPAISTGEILRREAQSDTELGRRLQRTLQSGKLIADDLMNDIVANRIGRKDCKGGFILDGFPRTVDQAAFLKGTLQARGFGAPSVFEFAVSADQLIDRLKWRRQCPTCSRIYGMLDANDGYAPLVCPNDRSSLVMREDDQPAVIRERLNVYKRNSADLIRYYETCDYTRIYGACDVARVTEQLFEALGLRSRTRREGAAGYLAAVSVSC